MATTLQMAHSMLSSCDPSSLSQPCRGYQHRVSLRSSTFSGDRLSIPPRSKELGKLTASRGRDARLKSLTTYSVLANDVTTEFTLDQGWRRKGARSNRRLKTFETPIFEKQHADPKAVASIILGGGAGTRLFPLTRRRAKPVVSKIGILR